MIGKLTKLLCILLIFVFASFLAEAQLESEVVAVKHTILPWEEAEFVLRITNDGAVEEELVYSFPLDPDWSIITNPIYNKRSVRPGETLETKVNILPISQRLAPKRYEIQYRVVSSTTGRAVTGTFDVSLRDPERFTDYVPIVNLDIDMPESIDPRKNATMYIRFDNRNRLNITDYTLDISSSVNPGNDRTIVTNIPPLQKKTETLIFSYPDTLQPTTDEIIIVASVPSRNITYNTIRKTIDILPYSKIITSSETEERFLKKDIVLTFLNDGNVAQDHIYEMPVSVFTSFFFKAQPEHDYKQTNSGLRRLVWNLEISPQEQEQISITINYRPLFIVLLLLAAILVIYYLERSPLVARKEARRMSKYTDETSRLKVLVHVRNRTNKQIDSVTVVDTIPRIAELEKEFAIGTMQPSKVIKHEKKGTIVRWSIPVLEPQEERIISYQVYSKLEIVGSMKLSPAVVKFKNKRGRISRSYSNSVLSE